MAEMKFDEFGNPYIQCENENELAASLGINLETIEGDYSEAFQHMSKMWEKVLIDTKFELR